MSLTDTLKKNLHLSDRNKHGDFLKTPVSKYENVFSASSQRLEIPESSNMLCYLNCSLRNISSYQQGPC